MYYKHKASLFLIGVTLLLLPAGLTVAATTGSDAVTVFSPSAFQWFPQDYVARMAPINTSLGYNITTYEGVLLAGTQGTALADAVKELLGAGVGIFVKTSEHGYKQPGYMLIAFYDDIDNRDADLDVLDPNGLSTYTFIDLEDMWGIGMGWPTVHGAFSNNSSIVALDDCNSLDLVSNGFSSNVGLGYSGSPATATAWNDAEIFWREYAKLVTLDTALGSDGCTLEKTSSSNGQFVLSNNLASSFHGACIQGDVLAFEATPLDTDHWELLWSNSPIGPFEQFATVLPDAAGIHYEVSVPAEYSWVQIREIETRGNSLIQA